MFSEREVGARRSNPMIDAVENAESTFTNIIRQSRQGEDLGIDPVSSEGGDSEEETSSS